MKTDDLRLHYTYGIAILALIGGFALLTIETPGITGGEKLAFIAGAATSVFQFVFNREQSVGTSRQTERAMAQGADIGVKAGTSTGPTTVNATGDTTVTGGDPTNVNVDAKKP